MALTISQFVKRMQNSRRRLSTQLGREAKIISLKLEREAKINATYFPQVRTGRLRSSIAGLTRTTADGPEIILQAGGKNEVNYAASMEFGDSQRRIKPRFYLARATNKVYRNLDKDLASVISVSLGKE